MADEKEWSKEKIKSRIDENELDLSLCSISKVPVKNMLSFTKVTVLDLSCNKINVLPVNFPDLTHIVQLDLSKNCLTELPADFGRLVKLKKLDLLNNGLSELPLSFARLQNLSWLDLKGNPIQETLPNIVGDCLTPAECTKCAKNIISHYEKLNFDQIEEEKRQKKQEETRKAKQLKKEEALRRKKREERQNKQKQIAEEKNAHNENTTDTSQEISTSMEEDIDQNECEQTSGSFWKWIILLSLLAVVMAAFVNSHEGDLHLMRKTCLVYIDRAKLHIETARDKILVKIDEIRK